MKKLSVVLLSIFLLAACGGGGGGGSSNGTAPEILAVRMYEVVGSTQTETSTLDIGDESTFQIDTYDPDKDISTIMIDSFNPIDSQTPYYDEPRSMQLPTSTAEYMTFSPIENIEVQGPAGQWRIEFYAIDAKGNESDTFVIYISIH